MEPQLPIIPSNRADDLHNLPHADRADLVLFMAGNQFMVMEEMIAQFQSDHPQVKRIFYETLPPGLELKQILAGGDELVHRIMVKKRDQGTTIYTAVHHRETPPRIAAGAVDVGPVWATEAVHAASAGFAFDVVEPGEELDRREHVNYYICKLDGCSHHENAQKFIEFIGSKTAQQIHRKYGFVSPATT